MCSFKTAIGGLGLLLLLLGLFLWQPLRPWASTPHHTDPHAAHLLSLARYVNPFIGTVGNGNVFPGADVPLGMVQWSPDTGPVGITRPAGYFFGDSHITGFSLTHLSGAGCVAYGDIPFMPTVRPVTVSPVEKGYPYSARFYHSVEQASPGYYSVLLNSGIRVRLSATPRTGIGEFAFPPASASTMLIDVGGSAGPTNNHDEATTASVRIEGRNEVTGSATSGHFCGLHNTYTVYFAARFSRPFATVGTWKGSVLSPGSRQSVGPRSGAWVRFDTRRHRVVLVKVGVSFVSVRNALLNLRAENRTWNFGAIQRRAAAGWNRLLNRIQATGGTLADEQVFYTALYHALLHPNIFDDVDGEYIGFDHRIHRARGYTQYANFSGWDIYRTEVQLLALVAPRATSDMMKSLVADASQSGWLPRWPMANDETDEMNGDSADPIIADAMAFGARRFDLHAALRYMIKGSTQMGQGTRGYVERPGISQYLRLGFAPPRTTGIYGSAATTLEYGVDDFAIARTAAMLGDSTIYDRYVRRAQGWQHLFNRATGFIEPALPDGSFPAAFNPSSMDGFAEGDSWQYSWMVPHNLGALFRAMGGYLHVTRRLDRFFTRLNTGPNTPYDWAGNEPGLEVPWEYDFAGRPWRTQAVVRRILTQLYLPKPWGLPGNDDLGTMSAWCVWAAMGLYPETPSIADLVLGSPLFPHVNLHLAGGHELTLSAPRAAASRPYIQALRLNGRLDSKPWLPFKTWMHGAVLQFTPGSTPNKAWGSAPVDAPPSFSSR